MKTTLVLCIVFLVGAVSGAPVNKKRFQQALGSPWSRVVMRAGHYQDTHDSPHCCDSPPFSPLCCKLITDDKYGK